MEFDDIFLSCHDLDIFFTKVDNNDTIPVHCATFESSLPENLNDDEYYYNCIEMVFGAPFLLSEEDIEIEWENVRQILGENLQPDLLTNEERETHYIRTFKSMAMKGFWSYDRWHEPHTDVSGDEDKRFILIAHPKKRISWPIQRLRKCNELILLNHPPKDDNV